MGEEKKELGRSEGDSPKPAKEFLIRWMADALRRTMVHYGYWLKELEYQFGMKAALEIEKEVAETNFAIQAKRFAKILNIELHDSLPAVLYRVEEKQLEELLDALCLNWLANDGVRFQAIEKIFGMFDAKQCNDTCWTRFSPYEAYRIKTLLGLPDQGGVGGAQNSPPIPSLCTYQQAGDCGRKNRFFYFPNDRVPRPDRSPA